MSNLFSPLHIRNLTLNNRIVMSPMCQYSSRDGIANEWHLVHYGSRAIGGAGTIIQESTAVSKDGRLSYADLGLWDDAQIDGLSRLTSFIALHGAIPGIQLVHAGRKASGDLPWKGGAQITSGPNGWVTQAPSPIPFETGEHPPVELSIGEIEGIISDFEKAAKRAVKAGYRIIEIHGAHGYLVHQFLSPFSNHRTDDYGGSFENRSRFLLEIVDRIGPMMTDELSLWVRISAKDWVEGGWDLEQSIRLAGILKQKGVDVIDVSSGGNIPNEKVEQVKGYQVPFSEAIRKGTGITTGTVGMITEARQAEEILAKEQADLIFIGRELLRDPYFALHAAKELGDSVRWVDQYQRAIKTNT